jgi:uncharacterized membrane protein YkoI
MRALILLVASGLLASAAIGGTHGLQRVREQDNAYRATQQGRALPFTEIRARIRVPGATFIGVEFDGRIYRLKFMRGSEVIWIDVDAATGRIIQRQ